MMVNDMGEWEGCNPQDVMHSTRAVADKIVLHLGLINDTSAAFATKGVF
jgi:hypothetical protein